MPAAGKRSFLARVLSREDSRRFATNVPSDWYGPSYAGITDIPFGSGIGFTSSPYSSYYDRAWGVQPVPDQARYRTIYRTVTVAHTAVDKLAEVATSKGFSLDVRDENPKKERILEICKDWLAVHPEFETVIQTSAKDLLIHGTAYVEPCFQETDVDVVELKNDHLRFNGTDLSTLGPDRKATLERVAPDLKDLRDAGVFHGFTTYHPAFIQGVAPTGNGDRNDGKVPTTLYNNPMQYQANTEAAVAFLSRGVQPSQDEEGCKSELVWLKNLDFLTMRIRRDAWGNVYGAIQYLVVPPVAFDTSKIVIGKWNPTSTFYESAYGVSLLQSLIRTQEAIWQIENDLLVIGHALAKPPHKFRRGILDKTLGRIMGTVPDPDWSAFQSQIRQRRAGSDLFLPPWVEAEPINTQLATSVNVLIQHLNYHNQQRIIGLKVPPQLLGIPEGSTRTTAQVNQGDYVLTVQSLQSSLGRMMSEIFACLLESYADELGDDLEAPAIKWKPLLERDETVELDKIIAAYSNNLLTVAEARRLIVERGIFEIPSNNEEEGYQQALDELSTSLSMELREQGVPVPGIGGSPGIERDKREATASANGRARR